MTVTIGRRELLAALGGAAAWPLAARAQQGERVRRIGVLMNLVADDPEASARVTALAQGLQQLGWTVGRNVRMDYRWGAVDVAGRPAPSPAPAPEQDSMHGVCWSRLRRPNSMRTLPLGRVRYSVE